MAEVVLSGVKKDLGDQRVVNGVSLTIRDGESVALLGPSGCGKTTTLNMIAGFLDPDEGTISIAGRPMHGVPPEKRNIGIVFQSYALFPHLTVAKNVAFGLEMRKTDSQETSTRVRESLALVHLEGYENRYPKQLSGGQQQRVALARALATRPAVLLLDEPLSNLDAKMRQEVRDQIAEVQQRTKTTMIFVTHDQEEAIAVASRVAVMDSGIVQQVGPAQTIYEHPRNRFVATFVGDANLVSGKIVGVATEYIDVIFGASSMCVQANGTVHQTGEATLLVRPERVRVTQEPGLSSNEYTATLRSSIYLGARWRYTVDLQGLVMSATSSKGPPPGMEPGASVFVGWDAADVSVLQPEAPS